VGKGDSGCRLAGGRRDGGDGEGFWMLAQLRPQDSRRSNVWPANLERW